MRKSTLRKSARHCWEASRESFGAVATSKSSRDESSFFRVLNIAYQTANACMCGMCNSRCAIYALTTRSSRRGSPRCAFTPFVASGFSPSLESQSTQDIAGACAPHVCSLKDKLTLINVHQGQYSIGLLVNSAHSSTLLAHTHAHL